MIDFIDAPYEVNETDGVANVAVGVVRGQLMREVVVELSFSDGTAIGKQCLIECLLLRWWASAKIIFALALLQGN